MPNIETMSIEEIEAAMAQLRERRKDMKSVGKVAQRKIVTLAQRREHLLQQVNALDEQIEQLRAGNKAQPTRATEQTRTRRNQSQTADVLEEILACVQRHVTTQRATIIAECHLKPATASLYLRQLCAEGKLIRHGEKRATTYTMP